jgi:hypothetical protein
MGHGGGRDDGIGGVDGRLARELGGARGTTALVRLDMALRGSRDMSGHCGVIACRSPCLSGATSRN